MKYSIITIIYNDKLGLTKTIENVYNQTSRDFEYIIIDGASSDGSFEIANSFIDKFKANDIPYTVISEKDTGIYNAMNKGIDLAVGEYVSFMNAGDCFASSGVLDSIFSDCQDVDILYGDSYVSNKNKIVSYRFATEWKDVVNGIPFCHQASFVKSDVLKEFKFNEEFKIGADYDMFLRLYLAGKTALQVYKFISIFDNTGVSSNSKSESSKIKELHSIQHQKSSGVKKLICKCRDSLPTGVKKHLLRLKYTIKRKQWRK